MTTSTITWTRPADKLPDDETNVLIAVRTSAGLRTSCEGFRCDEQWYDVCATPIEDEVLGWADMPECAL